LPPNHPRTSWTADGDAAQAYIGLPQATQVTDGGTSSSTLRFPIFLVLYLTTSRHDFLTWSHNKKKKSIRFIWRDSRRTYEFYFTLSVLQIVLLRTNIEKYLKLISKNIKCQTKNRINFF
jgi:hypothetical protein